MIKLAIISDDPGHGGSYKVAQDIALGLPKEEYVYQFFFLCNRPHSENAPEGIYLGSPKFDFDYSLFAYLKLAFIPSKSQEQFETMNNAIRNFQPDIIHFHTHPISLSLINGLRKVYSKKCSYIFTDHLQRISKDTNKLYKFKDRILAKVYAKLFSKTFTIFISKLALSTAKDLGYAIEYRHDKILNTVNTELFIPVQSPPTLKINVIYLARLIWIKGHDILLNAWYQLPKIEGLELHLYGIEADGGMIKNRIQSESYPNPVRYLGTTSTPDSVLREATIGVFPSYREGMPLALLEMMATGLPIVASDIPEIESLVTDQEDLLLFRSGDSDDLKEKLLRLIDNPTLRHQLGINARKKVENFYSKPLWESYHELYKQTLKI